jgi:hypothetical protein
MNPRAALPAALLLGVLASSPLALAEEAGVPEDVAQYLSGVAGFEPARLEALRGGSAIAKVAADKDGQVAIVGAVRIRTSKEHVQLYFDEYMKFEDGEFVLRVGRFSRPPVIEDLARLELDDEDIEALRACKVGDCALQIGAHVGDLLKAVDWKAPDYRDQANRFVRQRLVDYVEAYDERGDEALVVYRDGPKPLSLATQWRTLVASAPYLHGYAPALRRRLEEYPRAPLEGGRDFIQWSKVRQGLKPVVAVTHVVVYQDPAKPDRLATALKQIYASRSYEGAFSFATVVEASGGGGAKTSYVVFVNRTNTDVLGGALGGVKRMVTTGEVLKATELTLRQMQEGLEKAAGAAR